MGGRRRAYPPHRGRESREATPPVPRTTNVPCRDRPVKLLRSAARLAVLAAHPPVGTSRLQGLIQSRNRCLRRVPRRPGRSALLTVIEAARPPTTLSEEEKGCGGTRRTIVPSGETEELAHCGDVGEELTLSGDIPVIGSIVGAWGGRNKTSHICTLLSGLAARAAVSSRYFTSLAAGNTQAAEPVQSVVLASKDVHMLRWFCVRGTGGPPLTASPSPLGD